MKPNISKESLIRSLELTPHPIEGGYFRRTYESETSFNSEFGQRKLLTSIYYMLTSDNPIGYLHKNQSDIMHYFHMGSPTKYVLVSPQGEMFETIMGNDIESGQQLQLLVPGGYWKASVLCKCDGEGDDEYSLISEAVSPGFEYADNELASTEVIQKALPNLIQDLKKYIR